MHAEDRVIHFAAELIHAPKPIAVPSLQKLYFELAQTKNASYDSTDFTNPQQARFYSRRGAKTQSIALFLADRVVVVEEWADIPLSDFLVRLQEVALRVLEARMLQHYLAHTATIRSTFALTHYEDARVFLLDHACGQEGKLGPYFQRPVATGGLRFVLPETNEHQGALHIAIESYRHSRNEVFVEAKGVFGRQIAGSGEIGLITEHVRYTREFICKNIYPYLQQYDHAQDGIA